jgi:predicted phosphodiesterase
MRIAVMTDSHANLPALQAALAAINKEGYDVLVHTGDAIAIGPYPSECLELLTSSPNIRLIKGNHESYFVEGITDLQPSSMSAGEVQHQRWTHERLGPTAKALISHWPYRLDIEDSGTRAMFVHYPLDESGREFLPIRLVEPSATQLDDAFCKVSASVIFCGHEHSPFDVQGRCRYVNPGSLGCSREASARYCVLDISPRGFTVTHHSVAYDMTALLQAFEQRNVPERELILRVFFGRSR